MLRRDDLTKLINLEGEKFKDIQIQEDEVRILVERASDLELCPCCHRPTFNVVDITPKVYRDLSILGRKCYIEVDLRRFECRKCGTTFNEPLSFAAAHRRYTSRFEQAIYRCCQETTATYAGLQFGIDDKTATAIYYQIARQRQEERQPSSVVEVIGIDEIAMHKGHRDFVVVITDLTNKKVITILKDRKKETLEAFFNTSSEEFKKGIKFVAIDLWGPYRGIIESMLPNAKAVADRFHVMQNLNRALDDVRKQEKRKSNDREIWKHAKYAVLKNREDLTAEQEEVLNKVLQASATLKACYELKESFRAVFNESDTREVGMKKLYTWVLDIARREIEQYYEFMRTVLHWEKNILNYFDDWISSGFVEGVNNKIKLIKRKAFGFVNFENFRIKIVDCFS